MEFRTLAGAVEGEDLLDVTRSWFSSLDRSEFYRVRVRYTATVDPAVEGVALDWSRFPERFPAEYADQITRGFQKAKCQSPALQLVSLRVWVLHASTNPLGGLPLTGLQTRGRWVYDELLRQTAPLTFDPAWRTPDVLALARAVREDAASDRLPVLADALMDAGCTLAPLLDHCRADCDHGPACWAADLVLGPPG